MNVLPFPLDTNNTAYYNNKDASNYLALPIEQYIRSASNLFVPVSVTNPLPVTGVMVKGEVTTAHNAITGTATSTEISCVGYNSILIEVDISVATKLWTFTVQGCMVSGGTFIPCSETIAGNINPMSYQTNISDGWAFKGIPDYIKIVATEDEDGATVTVKVQPCNL